MINPISIVVIPLVISTIITSLMQKYIEKPFLV